MGLIALLAFVTVFLLVYQVGIRLTARRRRIVQRLDEIAPALLETDESPRRHLRMPFVKSLEAALARGEFRMTPREFFIRWALITLLFMLLAFLFRGVLAVLVVFLVSAAGTWIYVRSRGRRRLVKFEAGLNDFLTITANSLRAGFSFVQAVQVVAEDVRGPVQQELLRILGEINVGVPLEQAFHSAAQRMKSEDFSLIVTAVLIQRQVGGNLAEILDEIAQTIRERIELKDEAKVLTSQGRMSVAIFMVLPIALAVIMYFVSPSYFDILLQSKVGIAMLVGAALLQVIGFFVIRRVIDIEL